MPSQLTFANFVVHLDERRLQSHGQDVHLAPKTFELLKLLIDNRPKAVSKQEISERLWPETFVGDSNLATVASELRAALGDDPSDPHFIRTVYAYGYAFIAEARETGSPLDSPAVTSRWMVIHERRRIPLAEGVHILGRGGDDVIAFDSPTVSRHHARLTVSGDDAAIEDLDSKNGTWVDQSPVTARTGLHHGDEIRLGSVLMVVHREALYRTTATMEAVSSRPGVTGK